jgi:hypothetical protein
VRGFTCDVLPIRVVFETGALERLPATTETVGA